MRVVFRLRKPQEHQTVLRVLRRMILESGLAFEPAKINIKWPRFAYGPALPLGVSAAREYVDVYLVSFVAEKEVQDKLQKAGNDSVEILKVFRVPYVFPSVQQLATVALYNISGHFADDLSAQTLEKYFTSDMEVVFRASNGLSYTQSLAAYVRSFQQVSTHQYQLWLQSIKGKWINPCVLLFAALGKEVPAEEGFIPDDFTVVREGLFWQDNQGEIHLI